MKNALFLLMFLYGLQSNAQQVYLLEIISPDNPGLLNKISYKKNSATKTERERQLQNVLFTLYDNAYIAATYDSLKYDSLDLKAFLHVGEQYKWARISKGNADEAMLSEVGFREKIYFKKKLNYKEVRRLLEKMVSYYENNGYPFVSAGLDSIVINGNSIAAQLKVDRNKLVKIDSILIRGNANVAPVYLQSYIGVKTGSLYNESRIRNISPRLKELAFVREKQPSRILFTNKETKLVLELEKRRASQFDGIIGFLPDNNTRKLLITGDVRLKLQNAFGRGELIDLNWRSLRMNTQDLKLKLTYPFLFATPFGIDYDLKLYKLDTSYIDVYNTIGLQYLISGGNYFKITYSNKTSRLLSTKGLEFATTLPVFADISANAYGFGIKFEKLDYRFNPRKGYSMVMSTSVGSKTISENPRLNPVVYDKLELKTVQYAGEANAAVYIPIAGRSIIKLGVQSAYIAGPGLFQNELYRIGGLKTLRGFDEESIRASAYVIGTVEYRFLLEQNSYFHLFYDGSYYENNTLSTAIYDTPYGFGTGVSFETKAGIFSLDYALGSQSGNPIYLKSGKIHFGIVSYF